MLSEKGFHCKDIPLECKQHQNLFCYLALQCHLRLSYKEVVRYSPIVIVKVHWKGLDSGNSKKIHTITTIRGDPFGKRNFCL